jgi:hypothetical protein
MAGEGMCVNRQVTRYRRFTDRALKIALFNYAYSRALSDPALENAQPRLRLRRATHCDLPREQIGSTARVHYGL